MANIPENAQYANKNVFFELLKDRFAFIAFLVLFFLYLLVFLADFIAPYSENFSDRKSAYAPPSVVYTINENGKFSKPYVYNYVREFDSESFRISYKPDRSKKYYLKFFTRGEKYKIFGLIPCDRHFFGVEKGGKIFLLGTDINGRDNFSRLLFGGQISLTIGFLALFISFPIGMLYGGFSGYLGGKIDNIMMRFSEGIMSIPGFYLLVILAYILPANMTSSQRFALIVAILALIGWAGFARVVRGMVLSIKEQDFVQAARSIGASNLRIIVRHILPQTMSYVIVAITLSVPSYILSESGLSFIGLGIQQPDASWGNMLKEAQSYINIVERPWLLAPGFLIFVAVLAFNVIGDTIRDILDPKSHQMR